MRAEAAGKGAKDRSSEGETDEDVAFDQALGSSNGPLTFSGWTGGSGVSCLHWCWGHFIFPCDVIRWYSALPGGIVEPIVIQVGRIAVGIEDTLETRVIDKLFPFRKGSIGFGSDGLEPVVEHNMKLGRDVARGQVADEANGTGMSR
jgi:hypothetical protein